MTKPNILIFDAVCPIPVGKQLETTLKNREFTVSHIDAKNLKIKPFYKIRRGVKKLIRNLQTSDRDYFFHPKTPNNISKLFRQIRPDIVLIIGFFYPYLNKKLLLKLKKELGFKLFLLDTDTGNMMPNFRKVIYFLNHEISVYDKVFSFSKVITNFMNQVNQPHIQFFPYGADMIPAMKPEPKQYDICFIGMPEMRRVFYLEKLKNYRLMVCGEKWTQYLSLLSPALREKVYPHNIWNEKLYQLLNQTKIILNLNSTPWQSLNSGVNLRVFEALAAKAFLLTDHCEELNELFRLNHDLVSFKTIDELEEKVTFYLKHDDLREKIAMQGHETFLKYYTWEKRTDDLIERMLAVN